VKTRSMFSAAFALMLLSSCGDKECTSCLDVTVSGLVGSRLSLENNDVTPGRTIGPGANGIYPYFFGPLPSGTTYNVTVGTQPTNPSQTCVVANGTGMIGDGVTVSVTCTTMPGRFLYVVNSLGPVFGSGSIYGYAIDSSTGALTSLNGSPFLISGLNLEPGVCCNGKPTAFTVDPSGRHLYVAISGLQQDGRIDTFTIDATSGAPSEVGPELFGLAETSLAADPSGRFLYGTASFQLFSGVFTFAINAATGELTYTFIVAPLITQSEQPSSVSIDPLGRFAYVSTYTYTPPNFPGAVEAFAIDNGSGALTAVTGSPIAAGFGAAVVIVPSGSFAYVPNVDSSDISGYAIDPSSGVLKPLSGSPFATADAPSALGVDPFGKVLYATNALSNTLSAYRINASTGALRAIEGSSVATASGPTSVTVDPTGRFAYVTNYISNDISAYTIDPVTGRLTEISGSPFARGGPRGFGPSSVAISIN
jgi:6-phosphogluconolactonase